MIPPRSPQSSIVRAILAALAIGLGLAASERASAQPPPAILSNADAGRYAAAFAAAERSDGAAAEAALAGVADPCLAGSVRSVVLTGVASRSSPASAPPFRALADWLKSYSDLAGADRVYALAIKVKPVGASVTAPPEPLIALPPAPIAASRRSAAARQAFFAGDVARAAVLAEADGDRWIAGLAAWRQTRFADARDHFAALASDSSAGDAARAAADFWAARAAGRLGEANSARAFMRAAASAPDTFYGMIARRRMDLADDPLGRLLEGRASAALTPIVAAGLDAPDVRRLAMTDARAHRAMALSQLGRSLDAGLELRIGLAMAETAEDRAAWTSLILALNGDGRPAPAAAPNFGPPVASFVYPTPALQPLGGFQMDRALVYAFAWRESRFDSLAVSPKGAIGLMQLMPASAAAAVGDPSFRADPIPLFDPATNLRVGQSYLRWLRESAVGPDLPRLIAAYNSGPGSVQKAVAMAGAEDDLAIIESLPAAETRDYVRTVLTAYWCYRRQFGRDSASLDALAQGAKTIDIDLDR